MRVYNFAAGPACLPEAVLKQAQEDFVCYKQSGMSVMEMSHRSADYEAIINKAQSDLRALMHMPEKYKVLFLQGGASMQFAMVPLNLMSEYRRAYYVNTGAWSKKAIAEAKKTGEAVVVASSEDKTFSYIPELEKGMFGGGADYVHITHNNTIYGTRYTKLPETDIPLVADMSSSILSEETDVSRFGIIYAGAQKNIGPAGLTVVIIREDLIGRAGESVPTMLNYKTHAENGSMFNTPPTFAIYIAGLVFEYLIKNGGIAAMQKTNEKKAAVLYDYLDGSALFSGTAAKKDRSLMNVPFVTGDAALDAAFIAAAKAKGLVNIKGHRSVGGMRASIYNAMPIEGIHMLIDVMKEFERKA
ncbi:MAG: 3-phosphoserine/phosphohydroxythreonine transaminase [Eubacteriales bacterium]|nr:3-phosphoserine/phosphohydroxythreonine transaminase [Eubacteriales bacterium]